MNKEDREFLISLRDEMLNQEDDCQASPRFWVIRQEEREYWVEENTNGIFIYDNDECDSVFEGEFGSDDMKEWFIQFMEDRFDEKVQDVDNFVDFSFKLKDNDYYFSDSRELETFLKEDYSLNFNISYYRNIYVIKENTLFLTKEEAKKHLKENKHHYNNTAHTYAMTAWRSPKVEKLFKILENIKWEDIK